MKFPIKDFFSKCDQIRSFMRIWSHILKKSLIKNFIFRALKFLLKRIRRSIYSTDFTISYSFGKNYKLTQCCHHRDYLFLSGTYFLGQLESMIYPHLCNHLIDSLQAFCQENKRTKNRISCLYYCRNQQYQPKLHYYCM